ncbi:MAG TPA: recombinase family protein [Streptosporangiaceae bacterium]|nr:recombinase family protein [Streptosporangiaceae bacterium]
MTMAERPAAYIGGPSCSDDGVLADRQAMAQAARQRGWPAPAIYADDGPGQAGRPGPALGRLEAAVIAGRHDGLLVAVPGTLGNPAPLMRLLSHCTRHGVTVSFVPPLAAGCPNASARTAVSAGCRK